MNVKVAVTVEEHVTCYCYREGGDEGQDAVMEDAPQADLSELQVGDYILSVGLMTPVLTLPWNSVWPLS